MKITVSLDKEAFNKMFKVLSNWVNGGDTVLDRIQQLKKFSPAYNEFLILNNPNSGDIYEYITNNPHKGKQIYRELFSFYNSIKENYE